MDRMDIIAVLVFAVVCVFVVGLGVLGAMIEIGRNAASSPYPQVYIHQDGSIDPPSTQIRRDGNLYTLEANMALKNLFVEKSNITFDGNGYSLWMIEAKYRWGDEPGSFEVLNVENVTLKNLDFVYAADLVFENSSFCEVNNGNNCSISINNSRHVLVIELNKGVKDYGGWDAVWLTDSTDCTVSSGKLVSSVGLKNSHYNKILGNDMTVPKILALRLEDSNSNLFFGNRIERTQKLFEITGHSGNNLFVGNFIRGAFNFDPVLDCTGVNTFYHNNFFYVYWNNNFTTTSNLWDNGSEGNYWYPYEGVDANGDGLGDSPHFIDDHNQDRHPLMNPLDLGLEPQPQPPT